MTAVIILAVLALVIGTVWFYLGNHSGPRARLGPDGTNVREPETFVVHHEGKGQGLNIANTALKERTEHLQRDLPGGAHKVQAPVPGRDPVRRGVTGNHRDVELAADLLPDIRPRTGRRPDRDVTASPSAGGQAGPRRTNGEGGDEDDDNPSAPYPMEQPDLVDDIPDIPEGDMPMASTGKESLAALKPDPVEVLFEADETLPEVTFHPDPALHHEVAAEHTWSHLLEEMPLPDRYGEDMVVVLVRNPRSLYVYWEGTGPRNEHLQVLLGEQWEHTVPVLRVFDVTSGAYPGQPGGHSFIIGVGEHDSHWFINEGIAPGRRYAVSYERMEPSGRTHLISHSGPVQTPAEGPAPGAHGLLYERYGGAPSVHGVASSWRQPNL